MYMLKTFQTFISVYMNICTLYVNYIICQEENRPENERKRLGKIPFKSKNFQQKPKNKRKTLEN